MEQHPVPQPLTSYEFRLVGDMTLKQFFKLASGVILALIVYGINPPAFIKWPLIILFVLIGVGMAFLPLEGRPLDVWIVAFFKRIYSPTQYLWKQKGLNKETSLAKPASQTPVIKPITPPITPSPVNISPTPPIPPPPVVSSPAPATVLKSSPLPPLRPKFVPPSISPMARVQAKFVPNIIIPATPTMPNLLAGFTHDKNGKIIEGVILEIRDSSGNPVRAFKSNKLGQFISATPLPNGVYEIEAEKEGFPFDILKIELPGKVLSPIEIVSK